MGLGTGLEAMYHTAPPGQTLPLLVKVEGGIRDKQQMLFAFMTIRFTIAKLVVHCNFPK